MAADPTLGHVHLKVRDLDRAVAFYRDVLGLETTERYRNFAFLSSDERHHHLALQAVGADAPAPGPGVGLYHTAWEVESAEALREIHERLLGRGVTVSPVDHGISEALYFADPDDNGIEIYRDTREENDRWTWDGLTEPFDPSGP